MTGHPRLRRFWQRCTLWSITLEGEVTWWCGDDNHLRKRKVDIEIHWPRWVFRPICWLTDGHSEHYGECVVCSKPMQRRA